MVDFKNLRTFWKAKKKNYYDRSEETVSITIIGQSLSVTPVSKNKEIPYALFTLQPQGTSTLPRHRLQKSAGSTPGTHLHRNQNWQVLRSLFISIGFCSALQRWWFLSLIRRPGICMKYRTPSNIDDDSVLSEVPYVRVFQKTCKMILNNPLVRAVCFRPHHLHVLPPSS